MILKTSFIQRVKFLFTKELDYLDSDVYSISRKRKRIPQDLREMVFIRDNDCCKYCTKPFDRKVLTIDHYIPLCVVQEHKIDNLVTACDPCNRRKGKINPNNPKHKKLWKDFLKKSSKLKPADVIRLIRNEEKKFKENKHDLLELLDSVKVIITRSNYKKRISFEKDSNYLIKRKYSNFWYHAINESYDNNPLINRETIDSYSLQYA
jgi:hypothetical protein